MATVTTERKRRKWLRQWGWMVLIWAAGVASLGLLSLLVRWLLSAAGLAGKG